MNERTISRIELKIDPSRLASIIDRAVVATSEVVNFHFNALAKADLSRPAEAAGVRHRFETPKVGADDRRALHESWMLARAFHELLRAVRHSLEEAHVYVRLLTKVHRVKSSTSLSEFLRPFQRKAASLRFPELLEGVNRELDPKIEFSAAYASLQIARNCLEHRAGIVSHIETLAKESFRLQIPRIKMFYLRDGKEVELEPGHIVNPGDDRPEVEAYAKFETSIRSFAVGERLSFTLSKFSDIVFACHFLGQQLATKLPRPRVVKD